MATVMYGIQRMEIQGARDELAGAYGASFCMGLGKEYVADRFAYIMSQLAQTYRTRKAMCALWKALK